MQARIIRPPVTRYQSECRLTVWRIASRIAWAAASSDMVMVRLHSTNVHQKIPKKRICRSGHLDKTDDDGVRWCNDETTVLGFLCRPALKADIEEIAALDGEPFSYQARDDVRRVAGGIA